ncbi:MAG TPA: hypothetical protein P5089_00945 [Candidatus Portnoybacteria bacterium]|nr:hypothetical protein [Candidatus Portnoybacteria bacterium]
MEDKELITKIQVLKEIKPSEDWVLSCRGKLAFRLEMGRKQDLLKKDTSTLKELFAFLGNTNRQPSFNLAYSLFIAALVVLGGGGATVWAAAQSLPGSPLYPVKLVMEKARVQMSLSAESRLQLQTQIADTRLQELEFVVNGQDSDALKVEKIFQVAEGMQDQLTIANDELPKVGDKAEPQKSLAVAKMVSDKASQASKAIIAAKESLSSDMKSDLTAKLSDAVKAAEKTGLAALEAMIMSQDISSTTKAEIAVKLQEEIKNTEEQVLVKEQKIAQANSFADKLPIRAVLINQFEQIHDLLDKAAESLNKGDFSGTLEMLKAAKAIDDGTDKVTENAVMPEVKGAASSTVDNLGK